MKPGTFCIWQLLRNISDGFPLFWQAIRGPRLVDVWGICAGLVLAAKEFLGVKKNQKKGVSRKRPDSILGFLRSFFRGIWKAHQWKLFYGVYLTIEGLEVVIFASLVACTLKEVLSSPVEAEDRWRQTTAKGNLSRSKIGT